MTSSPLPVRITPDRDHTLRGKRTIDWFFQNRKWLRLRSRTVQAAYALRPRPDDGEPLQFLFIAAKRDLKRAHDRNRAKRWMRAAIMEIVEFGELESNLDDRQLLVMFRIAQSPADIEFADVREAMREAAGKLLEIVPKPIGLDR